MVNLQTNGFSQMNRHALAMAFAALLTTGCAVAPSKYDLPVAGIEHLEALGKAKQKFVLCAMCPAPTPKTLAIPVEEEHVSAPQFMVQQTIVPVQVPQPQPQPADKAKEKFVILFKYKSSILQPAALKTINEIVSAIKGNPELKAVKVQGYTDDIGGAEYNIGLAEQRANAVTNKLKELQKKVQIDQFAGGKCCFVADNSNEAKRAPNRRVEVIFERK